MQIKFILIILLFLGSLNEVFAQEDPNDFQHPIRYITLADDVIAIDGRDGIYSFDALQKKDGGWQKIVFEDRFQNFKPKRLQCSLDGSGFCVLTLNDGKINQFALLKSGNNILEPLEITAKKTIYTLDNKSLVYAADGNFDKFSLFKYDFLSRTSKHIGYLNSGETVIPLMVDDILQLYIRKENGDIRMLNSEKIVANINININLYPGLTNFGTFLPYESLLFNGTKEDWETYRILYYKTKPDGTLDRDIYVHKTSLKSNPLPVAGSYVSTAKGDIIDLVVSDTKKNLSFLCYDKPSAKHGREGFYPIPFFSQVNLNASQTGNGVLVETRHPAEGAKLQYINFTDQKIEKIGGVDCKARSVISKNIAIKANGIADDWEYENIKFTSQKGHQLAAIIIKPKNTPIKTLIFDVYGAYGTQRDYHLLPTRFYDELRANGVAIIYPIVRGDGNWGRNYALLSGAPNRQAAVDDVAEVIRKFRKEILSKDGKIILRGASAGAWLSVQTAFNNPGLIDHVIANSGVYFFEGFPLSTANGFFNVRDSVDLSSKPQCQSTFFTLIHYIDDPITPISQSKRLAKFLGANSCRGELQGLTTKRHVLPDFRQGETDASIYELMKLYHGLENNLQ